MPMILDDDFTTHGLERLSSAATCLVAGVEYTHGQQISRQDPCEFCLCLDGEMFCWWQDCPPAVEGPCKDRGPFSPCMSVQANPQMSSEFTIPETEPMAISNIINASTVSEINNSSSHNFSTQAPLQFSNTTTEISSDNSTENAASAEQESKSLSSDLPETSTFKIPKNCVIMGKEYQIGDKLPHDTGNCLECICGPGAKVTCSPHQCAPGGVDDTNELVVSGMASQQRQDMF